MIPRLFSRLFAMGLTAGWIVPPICLLRLLLRKLPKKYTLWLWSLVGIRLVCPVSVPSAVSLVPEDRLAQAALPQWAAWVWMAGAGLMLLGALAASLRLGKALRGAAPAGKNQWRLERASSSFVIGVFRPQIYLSSSLAPEEARLVLEHERTHIRRGDPVWKGLAYLLLCLYWFHPLLWLAYGLFNRDVELACDQSVAERLSLPERKRYAEALIRCACPQRAAFPSLGFGSRPVRLRVRAVLEYREPPKWAAGAAVLAVTLSAACLLTNGRTVSKEYNSVVSEAANQVLSELNAIVENQK